MEIKINEMVKTKEGDSGIEIEGKVTYSQTPKIMDFGGEEVIKQFIVIKDDTGEQGCNATLESRKEEICKGTHIKFKGTVSKEYTDKKGKLKRSLNGYKIDETVKAEEFRDEGENVSQAKQTTPLGEKVEKTQEEPEKDMEEVWEAKDLRRVKECISKNTTALVIAKVITLEERFIYMEQEVAFFYKGNVKIDMIPPKIHIVEESMKEFGGTVEEKPQDSGGRIYTGSVEKPKEQKIAQAKELVKNPHLTEPVNDTMATIKQKKLIYGYINEEGKKIKGMVDSQYIKEGERKNIGEWQNLTKANGIRYYEYWYGKEGEMGERDERELAAKEKEGSPFATKRDPVEKRDPKDDASLTKDLLIEKIEKLRKENYLEDDEKFGEALGCNAKFKLWTEKELIKLKEKLEIYRPSCLK